MSLKDLRKLNLLRPEPEWSGTVPRSNVNVILAAITGAAGIAGCVFMAIGNGGMMTWIALGVFGVALMTFTAVNVKAIGDVEQPKASDEEVQDTDD
jgi:hypothetical protein